MLLVLARVLRVVLRLVVDLLLQDRVDEGALVHFQHLGLEYVDFFEQLFQRAQTRVVLQVRVLIHVLAQNLEHFALVPVDFREPVALVLAAQVLQEHFPVLGALGVDGPLVLRLLPNEVALAVGPLAVVFLVLEIVFEIEVVEQVRVFQEELVHALFFPANRVLQILVCDLVLVFGCVVRVRAHFLRRYVRRSVFVFVHSF